MNVRTSAEILREAGLPTSLPTGRHYLICPQCRGKRSRAHQNVKCLGVTVAADGVHYGCNHCGWTGPPRGGATNAHAYTGNKFVAIYDYVDESGDLLFQVCRTADKQFPQRKPDGNGGWTWKTADARKVLYRLPDLIEAIANDHIILIVEGEKDADNLWNIGIPATCNPGGAAKPGQKPKWRAEYSETLRGAEIVIIPDNDEPGRAHADAIARMSSGIAKRIRVLDLAKHWPEMSKGGDVSDWLAAGHSREELDALIERAPDFIAEQSDAKENSSAAEATSTPPPRRESVTSVDLQDFLARTFPPRELMLSPWLQRQGLAMIHGYRGFGKTMMAHGSAWAIATAGGFWKWKAPESRRVLVLDGEMPASDLQVRLRNIQDNSELTPAPGFFRIAAADTFRDGLPDLSNHSMQGFYSEVVADADFILLDNISTLCPGAQENDADGWAVVQAWLLLLRRQGKSVLLVHHDGKGGQQRGTSKKEDVLDTVISLRRPPDYTADQGCRLEVRFTKSRRFHGADAEPFEARLRGNAWELSAIKSGDDDDTLKTLRKQGLTIRDIADRTGLSKSTVSRRLGDEE